MAKHDFNTIIKFADNTTVVGLITNNNETAYREVGDLAVWGQDKNLSLNMMKTKEIIVDYRKKKTEHTPILIDGAVVEQVESFKFLGVHITNILSKHTKTVMKRV
jgi:hypothetical protein